MPVKAASRASPSSLEYASCFDPEQGRREDEAQPVADDVRDHSGQHEAHLEQGEAEHQRDQWQEAQIERSALDCLEKLEGVEAHDEGVAEVSE